MAPKDLTARRDDQNPPPQLSWRPNELVASVKALAQDVEKSVTEASDWYMAKRRAPSAGAQWTRMLAIVFVTLGGLSPLLSSTFGPIKGALNVTGTGAGYLFLALAAACVALDRYAGFSSSWMRRITTGQAIKRLVIDFRVQWPPLLAELEAKTNITIADVKPLFDRIAKLSADAEDLIKEETRLWKVEFESAFSQLEKATQAGKSEAEETKAPAPAPKPPAGGPQPPQPQAAAPIVPPVGGPQPAAAPPVAAADNKGLPAEAAGAAILTPAPPAAEAPPTAPVADSAAAPPQKDETEEPKQSN